MIYRRIKILVGLYQCVGGAFNSPLMAEASHHAAAQGGFPHPQIAIQKHYDAPFGSFDQPGKLTSQVLCFRFALQKQPALIAENTHNASWSSSLSTCSAPRNTFGMALMTSVGISPM